MYLIANLSNVYVQRKLEFEAWSLQGNTFFNVFILLDKKTM